MTMAFDMRPFMMATPNQRKAPPTPEELHRNCAWCHYSVTYEAKDCFCLRDCGKPLCPKAEDLTEFQNPSLPRFQ